MSSPLAIAAVTTALVDLLSDGLIGFEITNKTGDFGVTARSPGLIKLESITKAQLNLFMYMVTPNTAWSNTALPSRNERGNRMTNPPLALNLHYMLTAYGKEDFQAEMLLGYAMHLLHETPVLTRDALNTAFLARSVESALFPNLSTADLANQVDLIKITPQYLSVEEQFKLWSAFQVPYQPTVAYQVSVVLIEGTRPTRAPLPVLQRQFQVQPGALPHVNRIELPHQQPSAQIGDSIVIHGEQLGKQNDYEQVRVQFIHPRLNEPITLPVDNLSADHMQFTLQDESLGWMAGQYTVAVQYVRGDNVIRTTNALMMAIAPRISNVRFLKVAISSTSVPTISMDCSPNIQPGQPYALLLDDQELRGQPLEQGTHTLNMPIRTIKADISYLVRLRVDGVESLPINSSNTSLSFDPTQRVTIRA
jgi:hypothetical protein